MCLDCDCPLVLIPRDSPTTACLFDRKQVFIRKYSTKNNLHTSKFLLNFLVLGLHLEEMKLCENKEVKLSAGFDSSAGRIETNVRICLYNTIFYILFINYSSHHKWGNFHFVCQEKY